MSVIKSLGSWSINGFGRQQSPTTIVLEDWKPDHAGRGARGDALLYRSAHYLRQQFAIVVAIWIVVCSTT